MPWIGGERLTNAVDAIVVELLLVEAIRTQAKLQHGNARCIVLHHDRWLNALGHQIADGVARRDDLAHREIDVDIGLEVDLLDTDAGQRLRLNITDVIDARADGIFAVGRDPLFHLLRSKAGVLPDQRDDRYVDPGKMSLGVLKMALVPRTSMATAMT